MIVCVTLNPLIEERYTISGFNTGGAYRDAERSFLAGGKGINVSRQLQKLGYESLNLSFLGGLAGKRLQSALDNEKLKLVSVRTESETRTGFSVLDTANNTVTNCMGPAPEISEKEKTEFVNKAKRAIQNASYLVCSGSSPCSITDTVFAELIAFANENDRTTILDSYGNSLKNALAAAPMFLHTNVQEAIDSGLLRDSSESAVEEYFDALYRQGIKEIYLTNGADDCYVMQFGYAYKVKVPAVKTVSGIGSGDAFMAGIVFGLEEDLIFTDKIKTAVTLGALNASRFSVCSVPLNELEESGFSVSVEPIGSKRLRSV